MLTTFFTSANRLYEMFVLPYVASGLIHDIDARVEVCLEDPQAFEAANAEAVAILREAFGDRFMFREMEVGTGIAPNSVRFLETPRVATEFTYIGDIDVLLLEPVTPLHTARMAESGLPYSNVLRAGRKALSGLHFTRTDAYYPVERPANADLNRDEELLYLLVVGRGLARPPEGVSRPMHGYHMSPNRAPVRREEQRGLNWGLRGASFHLRSYERLRRIPTWMRVMPHFDGRYLTLLALLELGLLHYGRGFEIDQPLIARALLLDATLPRLVLAGGARAADSSTRSVALEADNDRVRYENALLRAEVADLEHGMVGINERLLAAREVVRVADAMARSRRWRLGHFLLSLPQSVLGRAAPPTAADALARLTAALR